MLGRFWKKDWGVVRNGFRRPCSMTPSGGCARGDDRGREAQDSWGWERRVGPRTGAVNAAWPVFRPSSNQETREWLWPHPAKMEISSPEKFNQRIRHLSEKRSCTNVSFKIKLWILLPTGCFLGWRHLRGNRAALPSPEGLLAPGFPVREQTPVATVTPLPPRPPPPACLHRDFPFISLLPTLWNVQTSHITIHLRKISTKGKKSSKVNKNKAVRRNRWYRKQRKAWGENSFPICKAEIQLYVVCTKYLKLRQHEGW